MQLVWDAPWRATTSIASHRTASHRIAFASHRIPSHRICIASQSHRVCIALSLPWQGTVSYPGKGKGKSKAKPVEEVVPLADLRPSPPRLPKGWLRKASKGEMLEMVYLGLWWEVRMHIHTRTHARTRAREGLPPARGGR